MTDGAITAIGIAAVAILGAIVAGWLKLRNGAIQEWRDIVTTMQLRQDELEKQNTKLRQDCDTEYKLLRRECEAENKALRIELSEVRKLVTVQARAGIEQRTEIQDLVKTVDKKTDIIVEKVVGALQDKENGKNG